MNVDKLNAIFEEMQKKLRSKGMSVRIESEDFGFVWELSCGDLSGDKQFMIASVTKLFAATVLFKLIEEGKLHFEDSIAKYLPQEIVEGLFLFKGVDYSDKLTVRHLMTQTSGLPCCFYEASEDGNSGEKMMKTDCVFTLEERIQRTKELKPKFAPGSRKRSYYSDMNWDLFQPIIENLSGLSIADCYEKYIIKPLSLQNTYLYTEGKEPKFPGVWIDGQIYYMRTIIKSWPLSCAVISNNRDMITFLRAFFHGKLFSKDLFEKNNSYTYTQMFPMEYGLGHARFRYPGVPTLIGHSGATGVVCYYAPDCEMYISACINEYDEVKATKMLAKYAHQIKKSKGK